MKNALQTIATVFLLLTVISVNAQEEQKESEAKVDKEVKELSGISIIGKRATVQPWTRIGRNVVIGPNVVAQGTKDGSTIPSGTTIRASGKFFPYTV